MTVYQWIMSAVLFSFCCSVGLVGALYFSRIANAMSDWVTERLNHLILRCSGKGERR